MDESRQIAIRGVLKFYTFPTVPRIANSRDGFGKFSKQIPIRLGYLLKQAKNRDNKLLLHGENLQEFRKNLVDPVILERQTMKENKVTKYNKLPNNVEIVQECLRICFSLVVLSVNVINEMPLFAEYLASDLEFLKQLRRDILNELTRTTQDKIRAGKFPI